MAWSLRTTDAPTKQQKHLTDTDTSARIEKNKNKTHPHLPRVAAANYSLPLRPSSVDRPDAHNRAPAEPPPPAGPYPCSAERHFHTLAGTRDARRPSRPSAASCRASKAVRVCVGAASWDCLVRMTFVGTSPPRIRMTAGRHPRHGSSGYHRSHPPPTCRRGGACTMVVISPVSIITGRGWTFWCVTKTKRWLGAEQHSLGGGELMFFMP